MNNVLAYDGTWRYYLRHPIRFLRETVGNLRAAYSRATKGYAAVDVWNMNDWILDTFPPMLRKMADDGCGYPGFNPFESPEKWHDWLHSTADVLESLKEENWESRNEFADQFFKISEKCRTIIKDEHGDIHVEWQPTPEYEEIKELYFARAKELSDEYDKLIIDTFYELSINFRNLWD